ncbi:hypothetical protein AVEN_236839-1 [Araneus ventricosus]|uniref:Cyclic nucleotide-binding domain-containing protein n=1 Tax=Araneus ventricosus TaxID=182803 RepID=A0A4Y2N4J2_ARAVE|nr:hypothetical protein AVEN_236839-1 [Araneus ventricosus]
MLFQDAKKIYESKRKVRKWFDGANFKFNTNRLYAIDDTLDIFVKCQPEFLHDLVLKMRAYIFTPGDLICRKGEVAREMFIIADGILEVIR